MANAALEPDRRSHQPLPPKAGLLGQKTVGPNRTEELFFLTKPFIEVLTTTLPQLLPRLPYQAPQTPESQG